MTSYRWIRTVLAATLLASLSWGAATTRVSVSSAGDQGVLSSAYPTITADGR